MPARPAASDGRRAKCVCLPAHEPPRGPPPHSRKLRRACARFCTRFGGGRAGGRANRSGESIGLSRRWPVTTLAAGPDAGTQGPGRLLPDDSDVRGLSGGPAPKSRCTKAPSGGLRRAQARARAGAVTRGPAPAVRNRSSRKGEFNPRACRPLARPPDSRSSLASSVPVPISALRPHPLPRLRCRKRRGARADARARGGARRGVTNTARAARGDCCTGSSGRRF